MSHNNTPKKRVLPGRRSEWNSLRNSEHTNELAHTWRETKLALSLHPPEVSQSPPSNNQILFNYYTKWVNSYECVRSARITTVDMTTCLYTHSAVTISLAWRVSEAELSYYPYIIHHRNILCLISYIDVFLILSFSIISQGLWETHCGLYSVACICGI